MKIVYETESAVVLEMFGVYKESPHYCVYVKTKKKDTQTTYNKIMPLDHCFIERESAIKYLHGKFKDDHPHPRWREKKNKINT